MFGNAQTAADLAARRLEAQREDITARYEQRLREIGSAIVHDPAALSQALQHADQTLSFLVTALRERDGGAPQGKMQFAENIGIARASRGVHPHESIRAAETLFDTLISAVQTAVLDNPDALGLAMTAMRALAHLMMGRIRVSATAYTSYLLDAVHQEHISERARIARELHDHIGNSVSVAYRQIELAEVHLAGDLARSAEFIVTAKTGTQETLEKMRLLISGLRMPDSVGLAPALRDYVDSVAPEGINVAIRVNGDERRTEDSIRGELFLMVREALYNAIVHARPSYISAHIDIMPDEIRAVIEDDGEGFDPSRVPQTSTGLASLNERLQLLNGLSKIESIMGTGTRIVIQIPLPKPAGG